LGFIPEPNFFPFVCLVSPGRAKQNIQNTMLP
jgi:hypothetical protein